MRFSIATRCVILLAKDRLSIATSFVRICGPRRMEVKLSIGYVCESIAVRKSRQRPWMTSMPGFRLLREEFLVSTLYRGRLETSFE